MYISTYKDDYRCIKPPFTTRVASGVGQILTKMLTTQLGFATAFWAGCYTPENSHFEPQNGGLVQIIFLFKRGDFQVLYQFFVWCIQHLQPRVLLTIGFQGVGCHVMGPKMVFC